MADLYELRPWLEVNEAAEFLTDKTGTRVALANVLRLALDGHLPLCVELPVRVNARVVMRAGVEASAREAIQGLWSLPMEGTAQTEIQSLYVVAGGSGSGYVDVGGLTGARVTQGDVVCELPTCDSGSSISPRRASVLPCEAKIVAMMPALLALADTLVSRSPTPPLAIDEDRPLATRERGTLQKIIAAVAALPKLDISEHFKAAQIIESQTERMGMRVSARAISEHLKGVLELIEKESRSKK